MRSRKRERKRDEEEHSIFSRESRLYKRVCPSVGPSVRHAFFFRCPNLRENELVTEKEYREGEASRD